MLPAPGGPANKWTLEKDDQQEQTIRAASRLLWLRDRKRSWQPDIDFAPRPASRPRRRRCELGRRDTRFRSAPLLRGAEHPALSCARKAVTSHPRAALPRRLLPDRRGHETRWAPCPRERDCRSLTWVSGARRNRHNAHVGGTGGGWPQLEVLAEASEPASTKAVTTEPRPALPRQASRSNARSGSRCPTQTCLRPRTGICLSTSRASQCAESEHVPARGS